MSTRANLSLYRPNVGIALFNKSGQVWLGRRCGDVKPALGNFLWQMPQGGIDPGEDPEEAARRELEEETGIREAEILGRTPDWITYDFPPEVLARQARNWRGQKQLWFAMRFLGGDEEINIDTDDPEFDAWEWTALKEIENRVVEFKRHVYRQVIEEFARFAH